MHSSPQRGHDRGRCSSEAFAEPLAPVCGDDTCVAISCSGGRFTHDSTTYSHWTPSSRLPTSPTIQNTSAQEQKGPPLRGGEWRSCRFYTAQRVKGLRDGVAESCKAGVGVLRKIKEPKRRTLAGGANLACGGPGGRGPGGGDRSWMGLVRCGT